MSRTQRTLCLFALMLAGPSLSSLAASLPEWAKSIASAAPAVDTEIVDEEFRVLFAERQITVGEDGVQTIRDRIAKQALSDHADDIGIEGFYLGPGAKIRRSRAWHSVPGKRTKKSNMNDTIDIANLDSYLTDRTVRTVMIDGIRQGSIVFFEFIGELTPYVLATEHTFAYSTLVDRSRLVVELPAGWAIHEGWLHVPGIEPQISGNTYTYEFTGLSYEVDDELALKVSDRAPLVYLSFEPPSEIGIPHINNWQQLGRWFEDLAQKTGTISPEIEAAAIRAGDTDDASPADVILGCATDVRDRVRYVAKTIGIGGYKPRYAQETLRDLWGDCKDKATLLRAMLKTRGVESYPVLVNLTRGGTVSETVAVPSAFDHMILAVSLPETAALPTHLTAATLEDEQLGRLLIIDTTDEYTSIGWMSGALSGRRALIVASDKSHLVTLPGNEPAAHRREREMSIQVSTDRSAKLTLTTRNYGAMASWYRRMYGRSQKELRERLESTVHDLWTGARIEDVSLVPEDAEGGFVATLSWSMDSLQSGSEGTIVTPFPRAGWAIDSTATSRRKTPIIYSYPRRISSAVTIEGVPVAASLPGNVAKEKDGWRVERSFARDGTTVHATWSLDLEKTRFELEEIKALKSLYRALRSVRGVMITIP